MGATDSPKSPLPPGLLMRSVNTLAGTTSHRSPTCGGHAQKIAAGEKSESDGPQHVGALVFRLSYRVSQELCRGRVSHAGLRPSASVQPEAVQARLQLLHLFTQEPLRMRQPALAHKLTDTFSRAGAKVGQMPRIRGVNYSPTLHLLMRKRHHIQKASLWGLWR